MELSVQGGANATFSRVSSTRWKPQMINATKKQMIHNDIILFDEKCLDTTGATSIV